MKRRYAFAQMYELKKLYRWQSHTAPVRQKVILPSYQPDAILELNPNWELDTMAQKARDHCLDRDFYAFALCRAGKSNEHFSAYHHVIEIRPMEIVRWMD